MHPLQVDFTHWLRTRGLRARGLRVGGDNSDHDDNIATSIHHLLIIGYVFFGQEEDIFHRTALELRGTLLKMERDHDNGKTMTNILQDNDRQPPSDFTTKDFTPYITVLKLYLEFLKTSH